jgi:hypothetical protein
MRICVFCEYAPDCYRKVSVKGRSSLSAYSELTGYASLHAALFPELTKRGPSKGERRMLCQRAIGQLQLPWAALRGPTSSVPGRPEVRDVVLDDELRD